MILVLVEKTDRDAAALKGASYDPADIVDDDKDWSGVSVGKPWGVEHQVYRGGGVSIWRLAINRGAETSMHCHLKKRALLVVESGVVILETLQGLYELWAGDSAAIEAGAFHRSRAPEGAIVLETETPSNRRDIVRLFDRYGRAGKGY